MKILLKSENFFRVEVRGFGVFEIKPTKARNNARNPKTNEIIKVPTRRKISFKPGKILDKQLKKALKEFKRKFQKMLEHLKFELMEISFIIEPEIN